MAEALTGRVALVTGAGGAIGSAIAAGLAAAGATVVVAGRGEQSLNETARRIEAGGGDVAAEVCDVRSPDRVERLASGVRERWDGLDVLCAAAGVMSTGTVPETDVEAWDDLVATNLTGTFLTLRAFLPLMRDPSSVITIGSTAGLRPVAGFAAYTATKAAVVQLTQACALDYASRGVRLNCICPGVVRSPIHGSLDWPSQALMYDAMSDATPLGYLGEPEDIARAALYLADPRTHWVTGSTMVVDGGLSLV